MSEKKEAKRKPGRPRKNPLKAETPKEGILKEPKSKGNLVEIRCDNPQVFKKICSYWRRLKLDKVYIQFTPTHMYFFSKNHKNTNTGRFTIDGSKITTYYCPSVYNVVVQFDNLEIIFEKLDASYLTIAFIITQKDQNKLHIITELPKVRKVADIDTLKDPTYVDSFTDVISSQAKYPLQFNLPSKYFKQTIDDVGSFDEQWTIEKMKGEFLTFKYKSRNGQVRGTDIPDQKVIEVDEITDEIFAVSFFSANLEAISATILADDVHFKVSKTEQLLIWVNIEDPAFKLEVWVSLIDFKKT